MVTSPLLSFALMDSPFIHSFFSLSFLATTLYFLTFFGLCHVVTKGRDTLGDKLNSKMSPWQITPCLQFQRKVAAIHCFNKLLHVYWSLHFCENLYLHIYIYIYAQQNFVAATSHKKIKWYWICVTCCWDKTLLQRQRYYSQKLSIIHKAICRCDVSPWHVAAACRLVSTDLNGSYVKHKNNCTWKIVQWSFPCWTFFDNTRKHLN